MTGIVDRLLRLAEMGRQRLHLRAVSLDQVVIRVIDKARSEIGDRRVEWRIGKLPNAKCDVDLMTDARQKHLPAPSVPLVSCRPELGSDYLRQARVSPRSD